MDDADEEIGRIERPLKAWFPEPAFIKAAAIGDHPILPEERALVANAVERRQREFATGRFLARQGLRRFGLPDRPILAGRLREPLWPDSVIGTISHDGALCAVALMRKQEGSEAGIGIDLVSLMRRPLRMDELASMFVTHEDELGAVAALNVPVDPALLLFSLKESAVKAISAPPDDFIDLRAIEIRAIDGLAFSLRGVPVSSDLFAAATDRHLVTAVKIRSR